MQKVHRLEKWKDSMKKSATTAKNANIGTNSENAAKLRSAKIAKCELCQDCKKCEE